MNINKPLLFLQALVLFTLYGIAVVSVHDANTQYTQVDEYGIEVRVERRIDSQLQDFYEYIETKLEQFSLAQDEELGAVFRPSGYKGKLLTRLSEGGAEATFVTTPNTTPDGSYLDASAMGDFIVITVNPGASNEEKISVSSVSTSTDGTATWTVVNRGLAFTSNTSITANKKAHTIGETVIISNDDHFLDVQYPDKDSAETITGQWTFTNFPITASTSFASETIVGAVELATGAEAASSTENGGTGYRLALPASIATSTAPASGNYVVVTGSDGNIDPTFIDELSTVTLSGMTYGGFYATATATSTFTGATYPQTAFITSSGVASTSNASATSTFGFSGFAVTNATNGTEVRIQTDGVVTGFTGLTAGQRYFTDTISGGIKSTSSALSVAVGRAISPTALLIEKSKRVYVYTNSLLDSGSTGSTVLSATINPGFVPTRMTFYVDNDITNVTEQAAGYTMQTWLKGALYGINGQYYISAIGTPTEDGGFSITVKQSVDSTVTAGCVLIIEE